MPQGGKGCGTCAHFLVDEKGEGYCVCLASREITIDCVSCTIMLTTGVCGPIAKWKHWERK